MLLQVCRYMSEIFILEFAVFAALSAVVWMASVTVLLPFVFLLKHSGSLRHKWFSFLYSRILKPLGDPVVIPLRKKAFDILKENLTEVNARESLKILEIGIGPGANLEFYPKNSRLTALDINPNFEKYFKENQKKFSHVTYEKTVLAFAENMDGIEDSSMDLVVATYVFCSVRSVPDCLKEIKRVLKPGGKFLFFDHGAYPKSSWSFLLQKILDPLWGIYGDGCTMLRNIADDINRTGFSNVIYKYVEPKSMPFFLKPTTYGVATK